MSVHNKGCEMYRPRNLGIKLFISASLVEHKRLEAKVQVRIFAIDFVLKYILIPNNCKDE